MVGTILQGRYKILRLIGAGGMGQVFLAHDQRLNRDCVIKVMDSTALGNGLSSQELIKAFEREAKLLASLECLNIPRVFDYFKSGKDYCLAQDLIEGEDLETIRSRGPISEDEMVALTEQILETLDYLHQRGIIYRDLKPGNIMRREKDGRYFLVDFGIARRINQANPANATQQQQTVVGTPGYASPEHFSGKVDPVSDIYTLGITLWAIDTGENPGDSMFNLDFSKLRCQKLAPIIKKAACLEKGQRFQSAREMLEAVKNGETAAKKAAANRVKTAERQVFWAWLRNQFNIRSIGPCLANWWPVIILVGFGGGMAYAVNQRIAAFDFAAVVALMGSLMFLVVSVCVIQYFIEDSGNAVVGVMLIFSVPIAVFSQAIVANIYDVEQELNKSPRYSVVWGERAEWLLGGNKEELLKLSPEEQRKVILLKKDKARREEEIKRRIEEFTKKIREESNQKTEAIRSFFFCCFLRFRLYLIYVR